MDDYDILTTSRTKRPSDANWIKLLIKENRSVYVQQLNSEEEVQVISKMQVVRQTQFKYKANEHARLFYMGQFTTDLLLNAKPYFTVRNENVFEVLELDELLEKHFDVKHFVKTQIDK